MELQERVSGIIAALKDAYPDPVCALQYKKDYEDESPIVLGFSEIFCEDEDDFEG